MNVMGCDPLAWELLIHFIVEREKIRKKKEAGEPPPWTSDPILQQYRFTNVNREDDRVTKWIAYNWRNPNSEDPDLWFAMVVARHVNLPRTLLSMGYPVPWDPGKFIDAIRKLRDMKLPAYNAAYMIRAATGRDWKDKAEYLAGAVLGPMWEKREALRPRVGDTLEDFFGRILGSYGLGTFLAAQVVADMKHVPPLLHATDWWDFAASGPGSRRGLNRMLGRDPKSPWKEQDWRFAFMNLREAIRPQWEDGLIPKLDAQNLQNCMCEMSKYLKTYHKEGRPKQRYVPVSTGLLKGLD